MEDCTVASNLQGKQKLNLGIQTLITARSLEGTIINYTYRKRGKIHWAKTFAFLRFSGVPQKFFHEYKCLSLIILNNEHLCTAYGQGNAKILPQKL